MLFDAELPDVPWQEPVVGFRFVPRTFVVDTEYQHGKLSVCGLEPAVFGKVVDPSFFIGIGIRAGVASGISAEGGVNMVQSLTQHRPALLGEPLTVAGEIKTVEEVPRGQRVYTDVWFEDEQGERVISAPRWSLRPDPTRTGAKGAGERAAPVVDDPTVLPTLSQHKLTPEIVKAYSSEGNSIHYDLASAVRAGFRAPLIGGGMGVHFLMAALWRVQPPSAFAADIYFRRPIFWDHAFSVACEGDATTPMGWRALCLASGEKVLTEIALRGMR